MEEINSGESFSIEPSSTDPQKEDKRTPLFRAFHAQRYQRQALIKKIDGRNGTTLICYTAGLNAPIDRDDPAAFNDLLHNLSLDDSVDFLLHTIGGDIDAAEKLILMLRQRIGSGRLRVIVPDFAKSAGTLIALGADVIMMSDASELGPIDPQIITFDKNGNRIEHSVQDYLDSYAELKIKVNGSNPDLSSQLLMQKFEPATIKHYENVKLRARKIAERLLREGMFKETGNSTQAASNLLDTGKMPSHGQMIDRFYASKIIGLNVEYRNPSDEDWTDYWQLYCLQKLSLTSSQKLFESAWVSLSMDS